MYRFLFLIVLFGLLNGSFGMDEENIPALIYSKESFGAIDSMPVGQQMSTGDFETLLKTLYPIQTTTKQVAIILYNGLTAQDLLYSDKNEEQSKADLVLIPSVMAPYAALTHYFHHNSIKTEVTQVNTIESALELFDQYKQKPKHYLGVVLTSHISDSAMRQRSRRQADGNNGSVAFGDQCIAAIGKILVKNATILTEINPLTTSFTCPTGQDNQTATLTMTFNSSSGIPILEISLVFARSYRSWYLNSTSVKTTAVDKTYVLKYQGLPYGLETPFKYSYACEESRFYLIDTSVPKIKPNSKVQIYFEKFQVQPFNVPSPNKTVYQFGTVNYCNGFFSNAIWMGLITTLLLATILACGLMGLSSVSTMDKFDDPKGKQLVIAAEK